ncbi:cyclic-phosphate processing receiver domain-containing protein [Paenibacillus sp. YYML68]|uniref:cyclic-phosphate processing receiver domain-containing protein n=1 Tax=Paenibacillus sp. YYML68 TaxID=2909250 RepID=UPI002492A87C|nr:cyclic-phosphate processing receiver domain-containing protein [Paenibacillus sp. YYML68]
MIHVYLDDWRKPPASFTLASTADECLLLLNECDVDVLSLDYDLGWNAPNGFEVVRGMLLSGRFARRIYLHTSSDVGRRRMYEALYAGKPEHVELHNGPTPDELLLQLAKGRV